MRLEYLLENPYTSLTLIGGTVEAWLAMRSVDSWFCRDPNLLNSVAAGFRDALPCLLLHHLLLHAANVKNSTQMP